MKFSGYFPFMKARSDLCAIFVHQVSYFGEFNTYGNTFPLLDWKQEEPSYYAYYTDADVMPNTKGKRITLSPYGNGHWPFTLRPATSDSGFTTIAIGDIDGDGFYDAWAINDNKELRELLNDTLDEDCAGFLPHPHELTLHQRWNHFGIFLRRNFFLPNLILLWIFILRDEIRWWRAVKELRIRNNG